MKGEHETEDEAQTRYGMIETGGGQCVIYDRENSTAWLQSDHVVDIDL
jgi:hypothetical protein